MASDKKKPSTSTSGNGGSVPSTKRPARTIELEAEDVTAVNTPEKDASTDADTKDAARKTQSKSDTSSDTDNEGDAKPDAGSPAQASEPRTRPAEIKSFVTHLAAGLAGGLIGVIGAGIVLDRLPVTSAPAPGASVATKENAKLAKRLDAVEFRLDALPKSDGAAELRETAGKLETRLAALEKKPPEERPEIKDMAVRLAKLEGTLKTLREAGSQEGASGVAQTAALTGKIDEITAGFETRLGELKKGMSALSQTVESSVSSQAKEGTKTLNDLTQRIGSFEEMISALENKMSKAASLSLSLLAPSEGSAALALAFESFRRAVERGHAYADHLSALKELAPDDLDLSPFEEDAATGVATPSELLSALPGVLKEARDAIVTSGNGTFLERVVTNARSVVRVRRIGPSEGDRPSDVLSRMEAQLKALNLAGILREAKGLKGGVRDKVQPWIDKAMARRATEDRLDQLGRHLLSGLQTQTDEKR